MQKTVILALHNGSGVTYHRVLKPMLRLQELYPQHYEVFYFDVTKKERQDLPNLQLYDIDWIFFNTIIGLKDDSIVLSYLELCLHRGAKIMLDIDDHFDFGRSVIVSKQILETHGKRVPEAIKEADVVTTTTESYANILRAYNPNVRVFSNFSDSSDGQYSNNKTFDYDVHGRQIIRIGLTGSVMHKYDVDILSGIPYRLKRDGLLDRVQFVLCGYANSVYFHGYEKVLTSDYRTVKRPYRHVLENKRLHDVNVPTEPYRRVGWRDINNYMTIYNQLDVLLAPLEDTEFNSAKSQIKYIEAGHMRTLFVGSDVPSYAPYVQNGHNGFLCKDKEDFYQRLKTIIQQWDNMDGFSDIVENAYNDVQANYESIVVSKQRHEYFQSTK